MFIIFILKDPPFKEKRSVPLKAKKTLRPTTKPSKNTIIGVKKWHITSLRNISLSFSVVPVISNAGNVAAIRAEAHRANPAVICPSSKNG